MSQIHQLSDSDNDDFKDPPWQSSPSQPSSKRITTPFAPATQSKSKTNKSGKTTGGKSQPITKKRKESYPENAVEPDVPCSPVFIQNHRYLRTKQGIQSRENLEEDWFKPAVKTFDRKTNNNGSSAAIMAMADDLVSSMEESEDSEPDVPSQPTAPPGPVDEEAEQRKKKEALIKHVKAKKEVPILGENDKKLVIREGRLCLSHHRKSRKCNYYDYLCDNPTCYSYQDVTLERRHCYIHRPNFTFVVGTIRFVKNEVKYEAHLVTKFTYYGEEDLERLSKEMLKSQYKAKYNDLPDDVECQDLTYHLVDYESVHDLGIRQVKSWLYTIMSDVSPPTELLRPFVTFPVGAEGQLKSSTEAAGIRIRVVGVLSRDEAKKVKVLVGEPIVGAESDAALVKGSKAYVYVCFNHEVLYVGKREGTKDTHSIGVIGDALSIYKKDNKEDKSKECYRKNILSCKKGDDVKKVEGYVIGAFYLAYLLYLPSPFAKTGEYYYPRLLNKELDTQFFTNEAMAVINSILMRYYRVKVEISMDE